MQCKILGAPEPVCGNVIYSASQWCKSVPKHIVFYKNVIG